MVDCTKFGFKKCDEVEKTRGAKALPVPNFPKPSKKFRMVRQSFNQSIEQVYFWMLAFIRDDYGFHEVTKVTDIFTASEQSSFWGAAQQRLQIQQGQVSNYMATIGKLIKELFQIVRELRILDERASLYDEGVSEIKAQPNVMVRRKSFAPEVVLRGYWVDLKDGGVKSPGSVYGLAGTLGYTALPDIFFAAPVMKKEEVDKYVDSLNFNTKLKDVLRRKLKSFILWREFTHSELTNRRKFTLKFLRQHYNAIQMYIDWIKPYLRNIKRLAQNFERTESEDLIGSFEGSVTEIEVVCKKKSSDNYYGVVVLNFLYRTQPQMDYHQDGYQHKGPLHVGRVEFTMRSYAWTKKEFDNYIKMREAETLDLFGDIDKSLKDSIEAMGDELRNYLKESGEKFPEDIKEEERRKEAEKKRLKEMKGAVEPFLALFGGFKEVFGALLPKIDMKSKKGKPSDWQLSKEQKNVLEDADNALWRCYHSYKKGHQLITW